MNFDTIGQYFFKLYNTILFLLLFPLLAFMFLYSYSVKAEDNTFVIFYAILSFIVMDWFIIFFFFDKKIKSIRNHQGLRAKLEKYFQLTIVRFSILAATCLVLAIGFFFTGNDFFTGIFGVNLVIIAAIWPTSSKVCKDLKLRGDEREMVYYKKDKF